MRKMDSFKSNSILRSTEVSKNKHFDSLNDNDSSSRNTLFKPTFKKINQKTLIDAKISQDRKKLIRENFLLFKEKIFQIICLFVILIILLYFYTSLAFFNYSSEFVTNIVINIIYFKNIYKFRVKKIQFAIT